MKIKINQPQFNTALSFLQKVIPSKPQLPILSSVMITADPEVGVVISATDLIIGMQSQVEAGVEKKGTVVLPGRELKALVNSLGQEYITIDAGDEGVSITTKQTTVTMQTQSHTEFPDFPEVVGTTLTIPVTQFETIVKKVAFAASTDQTRPVLTTVLWKYTDGLLDVVATDGFRLALLNFPDKQEVEDMSLLIPAKAIIESYGIAKQLKLKKIKLTVSPETKQVFFQLGPVKKFVRLVDGEFPPYEQIMPTSFGTTVTFDREELLETIKRALIFGKDSSNIIRFSIGEDSATISANSPTLGSFSDVSSKVIVAGDASEIAFNGKYILDYVSICEDEVVIMQMTDALKPAQFSQSLDDLGKYVVMPFRVTS